jgi:hypothetical protein
MLAGADTEILRDLQRQLLLSVLSETPLPGQSAVVRFPDLRLILDQRERIVSRENLAGEPNQAVPALFLTTEEIEVRAKSAGQLPVLVFRPPERVGERIRLTLELRIFFASVAPLSLGAIIATFVEVPGAGWQVAEQPAALGY